MDQVQRKYIRADVVAGGEYAQFLPLYFVVDDIATKTVR